MKRAIQILALLLVLLIASGLSWFFHPWIPANQIVQWNSSILGDYQFRVCQRKTPYLREPFETYLLVRKTNSGSWTAYCLDVQDIYGPAVKLKQRGSDTLIFHHGKESASFNQESEKMKDASTGRERNPVTLPGI